MLIKRLIAALSLALAVFLFAGCAEGSATALDVANHGAQVGTVRSGSGVDVIASCDGSQQQLCSGGECVDACQLAAQACLE